MGIVKQCIVEDVGCLYLDKFQSTKQLPLSRRTITDRPHGLSLKVVEPLHTIYFIASAESTDVTDSEQVLYFIRAIRDFIFSEKLLLLGTFTGRT